MSVNRFLPVFVCVAALIGPLGAGAQTPPPPAAGASTPPTSGSHHGHHHRESLIHALRAVKLTAAQQQQIATFRDQEKKANLNADRATKEANGAKMRQQIMGILTPDQQAQASAEMHRPKAPKSGAPAMPMPSPAMSPGSK